MLKTKIYFLFKQLKATIYSESTESTAYTLFKNPYNQYQVGLRVWVPQDEAIRAKHPAPHMSVAIDEWLQQPSQGHFLVQ